MSNNISIDMMALLFAAGIILGSVGTALYLFWRWNKDIEKLREEGFFD